MLTTAEPDTTTTERTRIRANAWGKYYVSNDCNGCGVCAWCAPDNFGTNAEHSFFAVAHQPVGEREQREVEAAMAACPLQCIHDDGDTD